MSNQLEATFKPVCLFHKQIWTQMQVCALVESTRQDRDTVNISQTWMVVRNFAHQKQILRNLQT